MANVYSSTRPLTGQGPNTGLQEEMAEYAYKQETQDLIQKLLADLFQERPQDIIPYMMQWLEAEQKRRQEKQAEDSSEQQPGSKHTSSSGRR